MSTPAERFLALEAQVAQMAAAAAQDRAAAEATIAQQATQIGQLIQAGSVLEQQFAEMTRVMNAKLAAAQDEIRQARTGDPASVTAAGTRLKCLVDPKSMAPEKFGLDKGPT